MDELRFKLRSILRWLNEFELGYVFLESELIEEKVEKELTDYSAFCAFVESGYDRYWNLNKSSDIGWIPIGEVAMRLAKTVYEEMELIKSDKE